LDWLIEILTARTPSVLIAAAMSILSFSSAGWCQTISATVSATAPRGFCGHNYAMLMTGAEPNLTPALGSAAGFPGALTAVAVWDKDQRAAILGPPWAGPDL